jgi:hypothetical protein
MGTEARQRQQGKQSHLKAKTLHQGQTYSEWRLPPQQLRAQERLRRVPGQMGPRKIYKRHRYFGVRRSKPHLFPGHQTG